ncbi:MAG: U32 family peptidase [Desulfobacterales bacterium]|nr:U32 family peptidase [Desulfobacterales bacterium]
MNEKTKIQPFILAPAGCKDSFLAAIAAEADAIYCGLKNFSARMEAENFTIEELKSFALLSKSKGIEVYITLNSIVKPDEIESAGRILDQLNTHVKPNAIIIQDLCFIELAKQVGYKGDIHLSTLANVSFPMGLKTVSELSKVSCVVVPRELTIDEIKSMAEECPKNLKIETFVHGALCYGVSGRCYWSSYLGGKSGLRGRCVQPCRRIYTQGQNSKKFFSPLDLSLDVLTKLLADIPQVKALKIEGRKKGPHYVYYVTQAYKLLRDRHKDPNQRKLALSYLSYAFSRKGSHYNFLSHKKVNPINVEEQTGSGLFIGKIKGGKQQSYITANIPLFPGDILRIGYEDESFHKIHKVTINIPKYGKLVIKLNTYLPSEIPVFLIDRKEKELVNTCLSLSNELEKFTNLNPSNFKVKSIQRIKKRLISPIKIDLFRDPPFKNSDSTATWISQDILNYNSKSGLSKTWMWLPPVIWPEDEKEIVQMIDKAIHIGCTRYVLNSPWQISFFKGKNNINIWAGPFCNITNQLAIETLANLGFKGVIVSPELGKKDYYLLANHSCLPLGIIISGNWPLSISRIVSDNAKLEKFLKSPKGEDFWIKKYDKNYWIFPNWMIDFSSEKTMLEQAGYSMFVNIKESLPYGINFKKRPGKWNLDIDLR